MLDQRGFSASCVSDDPDKLAVRDHQADIFQRMALIGWDQNALLFFNECSRKRNEALREYASAYGPLTIDTATACESDYWSWINEPWPWQEGGC